MITYSATYSMTKHNLWPEKKKLNPKIFYGLPVYRDVPVIRQSYHITLDSLVYLFHASLTLISFFHHLLTPLALLMCSISWPPTRPTRRSVTMMAIITRIITKLVLIHCCRLECKISTFTYPNPKDTPPKKTPNNPTTTQLVLYKIHSMQCLICSLWTECLITFHIIVYM